MDAPQRLFIGIELSEPTREALASGLLNADLTLESSRVRFIPPEKWHLTLQFLGSVAEARISALHDVCEHTARATAGFELELAGVSAFRALQSASVLFIAVTRGQTELAALASSLMDGLQPLGFERQQRAYTAHVTIARTRMPCDVRVWAAAARVGPVRFPVQRMTLFRSHLGAQGAHYQALAHYPLQDGGR